MIDPADIKFMKEALELAKGGLGRVAPNPSVGCIIVQRGEVIAKARTQDGGRPHAEDEALRIAGGQAKGATAYITLEPCFKEGASSCSDRLIKAGIARVVIGCLDENPAIHGKGVTALKNAGIDVRTGCLEEECRALNRGFFLSKTRNRPLVTLKTALSLDGKIATRAGQSQWITGEQSRARVQELRATHDAILTGIGTVLADDPHLTVRLAGAPSIKRIVLDSHLRMPEGARMLHDSQGMVTIFSEKNGRNLPNAEIIAAPVSHGGRVDLPFVLSALAERGITRLIVEAGQGVFTSFLRAGLWDDLYIMRAPILIGADGRDAFGELGVDRLEDVLRPVLKFREVLGDDLLEIYTPPEGALRT